MHHDDRPCRRCERTAARRASAGSLDAFDRIDLHAGCATRLRCVSITPFGSPVVPDEYGSTHDVVGRIDRHGRRVLVDRERGERRQSRRLIDRDELDRHASTRRSPRFALSASALTVKSILTSPSSSWNASSSGRAHRVRGVRRSRPSLITREEHDRPLRHVRRPQRDDVALLDAAGGEPGCGPADAARTERRR